MAYFQSADSATDYSEHTKPSDGVKRPPLGLREYLYMLEGGGHPPLAPTPRGKLLIRKFDARVGREANFSGGTSAVCVFEYPENRAIPVLAFPGVRNEQRNYTGADLATFESWGFTLAEGKFFVSLHFENKVLEIDPKNAEVTGVYPVMHRGLMVEQVRFIMTFADRIFANVEDLAYAKKSFPDLFREGAKNPSQFWWPLVWDFKLVPFTPVH